MIRSPKQIALIAALGLAAMRGSLHAEDAQPIIPPAASPGDIEKLIGQLDDKDFAARNAADKRLRALGWSAVNGIVIARTAVLDEETRARLVSILEDLCWNTGGLNETSANAVNQYRAIMANAVPDPAAPLPAVAVPAGGGIAVGGGPVFVVGGGVVIGGGGLIVPAGGVLILGGGGVAPVVDKAQAVSNLERSAGAASIVCRATSLLGPARYTPAKSIETAPGWSQYIESLRSGGKWDELEWQLACNGCVPELIALVRRRGDAVRLLEALQVLQKSGNDGSGELEKALLHLMIAAGREDDAMAAAEKMRQPEIAEGLLAQRGDWKGLAQYAGNGGDAKQSLVRVAALQFGGDHVAARKALEADGNGQNGMTLLAAELFGRTDVAVGLPNGDMPQAIDMLLSLRQYRDAIACYEKAAVKTDKDGNDCQYLLLPAYVRLNETKVAAEIVSRFAAGHPQYRFSAAESAVNHARLELRDFDGVAASLATLNGEDRLRDFNAAAMAFPEHQQEIRSWLHDLRPSAGLTAVELRQVADILAQRLPARELAGVADRAINADLLLRAAAQFQRDGENELAEQFLQRYFYTHTTMHAPDDGWKIDSGEGQAGVDFLMSREWKLVDRLFEAYRGRGEEEPVVGVLGAYCRQRLGDAEGAEKLLAPTRSRLEGDSGRNAFLAKTFFDLDELDLAASYAKAITDIERPAHSSIYQFTGDIERRRGNFAKALQNYRMAIVARIGEGGGRPSFEMARSVAFVEARLALQNKDASAALDSGKALAALDPENIDLTLQLIAALREADRQDQAKSLAELNRELLEKVVQDFPNSHLHHFLIAKLDKQSGFTNDQTQIHLQTARQLAPENTEYQALK